MRAIPLIRRKMKFFSRKKDKQKNGSGATTEFDSGYDNNNTSSKLGGFVGNNNGGGLRHGGYQAFASPPLSPYSPGSGMTSPQFRSMATRNSAALLASLPLPILERIFAFVCPHTLDESYETCEQSALDDACMLCDLRDLAHCVATCRRWRTECVKRL
jgi:hypothetical protein